MIKILASRAPKDPHNKLHEVLIEYDGGKKATHYMYSEKVRFLKIKAEIIASGISEVVLDGLLDAAAKSAKQEHEVGCENQDCCY